MSTNKVRAISTAIAILVFLGYVFYQKSLKHPAQQSSTPPPQPTQEILPRSDRGLHFQGDADRLKEGKPKLSEGYNYTLIEVRLRAERMRLAQCFLQNKQFSASRVAVEFFWTPSAALEKTVIQPDPGPKVRDCIQVIVSKWLIPSHPGLQPFQYKVEMEL